MTTNVHALGTNPAAFDPFGGPEILLIAPSTEPQREIWTATQIGEDASLAFNESVSIWFDGRLDVPALRNALSELCARHEALRTTFSADGLSLMVQAPLPLETPFFDLSGADEPSQGADVVRLLADEVETPFDLEKGPLFRATIVRVHQDRHLLVLTAHHIVCDGWSTAVLVKDLAALYQAGVRGLVPTLGAAEPFSTYSKALSEASALPERAADREYWRKRFSTDLPVLELPNDHPRPPRKSYRADRVDVALDAALVAAVRKMGAKHRASSFTTLLAGFKVLLHRLTGQTDLVVGIPAAGQAVGGHDTLVGHCVNMLPIRATCTASMSFAELLGSVGPTMLDALEHQQITLGELLQEIIVTRDPSRVPLTSIAFNVDRALGADALAFDPGVLTATLSTNKRHFENFELFVNAVEHSA